MNRFEHVSLLTETAHTMVATGKGLLAIDESNATCNKRFAALGIAQTIEMRRTYRELLLTTPRLCAYISGVILFDETFWQAGSDAKPFVQTILDAGMLVGIKVDTGTKVLAAHPDEHVTEGLDGLRDRLIAYFNQFAPKQRRRSCCSNPSMYAARSTGSSTGDCFFVGRTIWRISKRPSASTA